MTNAQTMIQGDCFDLMGRMPSAFTDAVITDPPYASGSSVMTCKSDPRDKYNLSNLYPSFHNDTHDQRIHMLWSIRWLTLALRITRPGGWLMVFSDWRQLPLISDAMQWAGWTWRGMMVWDKTEGCRPTPGMFRQQCEYILYATNGARTPGPRCFPSGIFRSSIPSRKDRYHITGKPVPLMEHLMMVLSPKSRILDPFAGSGSTLVAAQNLGHIATGIELSTEYYRIACNRLGLVLPS
ncbi:MAG: site-specific DNA-methyltransferase [Akkermansia sp.]|nr:site-specific DNA-methyltransferase [Akkermansia sp.]